ncbi:GNAT family N-acetyltransferase [Rhizobium grahamii]|uniref:Aminoglycoside N(6')-acetyltransferase type 1 n=1 Tax=Rhizobium grahamii TaxID=1120045 RepID=A0A5Q0CE01_9HYPH|nr:MULTISPECIES: aminoglycoside 6'-N-acetyltransferase [Rhizobium]QFY62177.1 GNAT family N-acetyltransferase [Rhizobium grahamii]QRM48638.1 GNAT family N-acetyltransferase [Rhizobium sp. BG6]
MNHQASNTIRIERASGDDIDVWAKLRAALWSDQSTEEHAAELQRLIDDDSADFRCFLAFSPDGSAIGFAEACLRRDYVNGCKSSPVLFLEGIYVEEASRRSGVGRALLEAVRGFGNASGCTEFASDALLDNIDSHRFHAALGFEETQRVVYFRQPL